MSLRFRDWSLARRIAWAAGGGLALVSVLAWAPRLVPRLTTRPMPALRVCADPNNLPFSNERGEGFENRLAALVADELHMRLEYTWASVWRGFVRKTLGTGQCDVVLGVPAESDRVLTTRPYYTSTYVFLSRRDRNIQVHSFDDPALRHLRIGIHFVGDDYANPPPAYALGRRHLAQNVVGYSLYGNHAEPNPPAALVHAVARGDVDVAVVWGPLAGYFASREGTPMRLTPVTPAEDAGGIKFTFAIAAGVRRSDTALGSRVDAALWRRRADVDAMLRAYGVPLVARRCVGTRTPSCE